MQIASWFLISRPFWSFPSHTSNWLTGAVLQQGEAATHRASAHVMGHLKQDSEKKLRRQLSAVRWWPDPASSMSGGGSDLSSPRPPPQSSNRGSLRADTHQYILRSFSKAHPWMFLGGKQWFKKTPSIRFPIMLKLS